MLAVPNSFSPPVRRGASACLNQAGIEPDALRPADVDETPSAVSCRAPVPIVWRAPRPMRRSSRCSSMTNCALVHSCRRHRGRCRAAHPAQSRTGGRGGRQCLRLLSGRNHRVYTAICLVTPRETFRQRLVETRVRFKRLTEDDIHPISAPANGAARRAAMRCRASRARSWSSWSAPTPMSSDCRFMKPPRAGRRGVSDPLRLVECQLTAPNARVREPCPNWRQRAAKPCPICGKPSVEASKPFCSERCRDVDLNRWLSGSYAFPRARATTRMIRTSPSRHA